MSEVKEAIKDMKGYRGLGEIAEKENLTNRVTFEQYLRAVIRGGDALYFHFLDETPKDHGQAHEYFKRLYEGNHISQKYSHYTGNIQNIMRDKSKIEYSSDILSSSKFDKNKKRAVRFLDKAVKPILKKEGYELKKYNSSL